MVKTLGSTVCVEMRQFIYEAWVWVQKPQSAWVSCHRKACYRKMTKSYGNNYSLLLNAFCEKENNTFNCGQCLIDIYRT